MKKGLLSLLAAALTIVSCQNYDDQFAELTGLVTTLKAEVAGVTKVQSDLTALSTLVGTLSTSLEVADQTTQISNITSGLASATTQIEAIEKLLGQVKTAQELTAVNSEVVSILAGVNTLLTKNASLQADLNIVDAETLETAQELILIGDQTPLKYILNGAATVDHTLLTPTQITTANLLTAKLISVTKAVTVSGTVDLSGLTSVLANYTVRGSQRPTDQTITTIGGIFTIDGNIGDISYPNLRNITGAGAVAVTIGNEGMVTNLDFGSIATFTAGALMNGGSFTSTRCTSIKAGKFRMTAIEADRAVTIDLGQTAITALSIAADSADTINVNAATASTGDVTVQATATTNVFFNALATNTGKTETTGANVAQFHIPALLASAGTININADIVAATKLATIDAAADFTGTKAVDLSAVKVVTAELTVNTNPVNIPLAQFGAGSDLTSTATTVIIGGVTTANADEMSLPMKYFTLMNQKTSLVLDNTESANLLNITATASPSSAGVVGLNIDFTGSAVAGIKNVSVANFDEVLMTANTSVVSIVTAGYGRNFEVTGATALTAVTIGHTYSPDYTDAQSVIFTTNSAITKLDLTSLVRLEKAHIFSNGALATITAPAITDLLTAGATLDFRIGVSALAGTRATNSLTATYTAGFIAVQDGINNSAYVDGKIQQPSLKTWADYLIAVSATNSIVTFFSLDTDAVAVVASGLPATTCAAASTIGTALAADNAADETGVLGMAKQAADATQALSIAAYTGDIDTLHELTLITQ